MNENKGIRWTLAVDAMLIGVAVAAIWHAVATYPQRPDAWDRLYIGFWVLMLAADLWLLWGALRKMSRRTSASAPPTGYVDRDGEHWWVRDDGMLVLNPRAGAPGIDLEDAERNYGPLEPTYG